MIAMVAVMSVRRMTGMTGMAGVTYVVSSVTRVACVSPAIVAAVRKPADCHGTKPNGASRQRDKVEIHGLSLCAGRRGGRSVRRYV